MRLSSILCVCAVLGMPSVLRAQQGAQQGPRQAQTPPPAAGSAAPAPGPSEPAQPPTNEAPAAAPEQTPAAEQAPAEAVEGQAAPAPETSEPEPQKAPKEIPERQPENLSGADLTIPSPGELGDRLVGDLPPQAPAAKPGWTAPAPILTLHGYFRARGELQDMFWLGRDVLTPAQIAQGFQGPDPFSAFRPVERRYPQTQCAGDGFATDASVGQVCKVDALKYANIRFRFSPQLNLSEDIRIKSTFDILDNYVLGDGAQSFYGTGDVARGLFPGSTTPARSTNPVGTMIVPRRVWAEVRNRDLGELRFGLMPDHWGLGMLYNAGNGLDDDYSTDLGRVMVTTKLMGFYLSAAYDFLSEGRLDMAPGGLTADGPMHDASQLQDLEQFTFQVVRRLPDEDPETVLARGDFVLDGGVRFQLRHQDSILVDSSSGAQTQAQNLFGTIYTPDVWGTFRYGKLRLGLEAAWVLGQLRNVHDQTSKQYVSQLGLALESELRLLNDKLGLYIYAGGATGDADVEGLSSDANYIDRAGISGSSGTDSALNNRRISTFRFNPAYRVDLILWRNLMRQVTGAMYVKPGISYDLVKDSFGQLFGARVDLIYSRASSPVQTWGNDPNLGVEIDAQLYWRSADGPNVDDGYHASLQYGVLFPLRGLGYAGQDINLKTAQTLRLVLGVMF